MDLTTRTRNAEISPDLELYTRNKLEKLSKYNNRLLHATVTFEDDASKNNMRSRRIELVIGVPGQTLVSDDEADSFYLAVDGATDKMKRQLRKLKTRRMGRTRDIEKFSVAEAEVAADDIHELVLEEATEAPELDRRIIVKTFSLKPMDTREAVRVLESNGNRFVVYINAQGSMNCLYKRDDGNYGLLAPENTVH